MNIRKQGSAVKLLYPWTAMTTYGEEDQRRIAPGGKLALSKDPSTNLSLWNTLGVASWAIPTAAVAAYLVNKHTMDKLRKKRDAVSDSKLRARRVGIGEYASDTAGLSESEAEDKQLQLALANAEGSDGDETEMIKKEAGLGFFHKSLPILAAPGLLWLASDVVNKELKDKYAAELDAEAEELRREQDAVDIEMLKAKGYLQDNPVEDVSAPVENTKEAVIPKEASASFPVLSSLLNGVRDVTGSVYLGIPASLMALSSVGLAALGSAHFLKRTDDAKKLKLLRERMLGEDRLLEAPKLRLKIPKHLKETDAVTQQVIPGIEVAEPVPADVIEAVVAKEKKKDAFL